MNRRGSALIEFAASLIVLSAMFTGIFQVGFTFFSYHNLVDAVSAGARYASLQPVGTNAADPLFAKSVRNMVVFGDPAPPTGAKPVVPGLTTEHVSLILGPNTVSASIHDFEIDALFSKVRLDGRPAVTFPVRGAVVPQKDIGETAK